MAHNRQCTKCEGVGQWDADTRTDVQYVACAECDGTGEEQCPEEDGLDCPECTKREDAETSVLDAIKALERALDDAHQYVERRPALMLELHALKTRLKTPWVPNQRAA